MAPGGGGGKRKRQDRPYSQDDGQGRPSPHRPEALNMAHFPQRHDSRGGGRRRGSRGGPQGLGQFDNHRSASYNPTDSPSRGTPTARSPAPAEATPTPDRRPMVAPPISRPALAPRREPSPPSDPPFPYAYHYVTEEIVASWQDQGKQQITDLLTTVEDEDEASLVLQEMLRASIDRRLDPASAGALYKTAIEARSDHSSLDLQNLLVDLVQMAEEADSKRGSFAAFLYATGIPAETWRKTLDSQTLIDSEFVGTSFKTMSARKATNILYRQQNYNLLREESEGYAKLMTEYFNTASTASAADSPPTIAEDAFQRIKALVGAFDLDVGRVLDITLDVMDSMLIRNFRFFVKFLRASSWWPEDDTPSTVKWIGQGFTSLPAWALPGSSNWGMGTEESERLARLRPLQEQRDIKFWSRAREVGMDAFFEIGARHITNYEEVAELLNTEKKPEYAGKSREMNANNRIRVNDRRKWMRETRTLPPPGNADAADLLGFKLSYYASPSRSEDDVLPPSLVCLAAFLIKIGFISLRDLYPHLHPADDDMLEFKKQLEELKAKKERASRSLNALELAGGLPDDTAPAAPAPRESTAATKAASPKPEAKPEKKEPETIEQAVEQNPKALLLINLLAIGALPEALFILSRYEWLADLVDEVPRHLNRIFNHMLSKVYEPLRPMSDRSHLSQPLDSVGDAAGLPKGTVNRTPAAVRPVKRWSKIETTSDEEGDGGPKRFYWDTWADNIPTCQNADDVFLMCSTIVRYCGVKIGRDPYLLSKLARIGSKSLQEDAGEENKARWVDLMKRLLVPALSMTKKNPGVVNEVWSMLSFFPVNVRYSIYHQWYFGPIARQDLRGVFDQARAEAKDVLKRISKENTKIMGKKLAKAAYASPGVTFETAIRQMESYTSIIDVFVDGSKYLTLLAYDVFTWRLLIALGGSERSRVQADGMLPSVWLKALAELAGSMFARYALCDPAPIMILIAKELRAGDASNLEVVQKLLRRMAGIDPELYLNEDQVVAMGGGPILQSHTLRAARDERHKFEKPAKRFLKTMMDTGLLGQFLISLAQEHQMYPRRPVSLDAPLKVLSEKMDDMYQVFVGYLDTMRHNLPMEKFDAAVPDVVNLIRDFGLEPATAFNIARPSIRHVMAEADAARKAQEKPARIVSEIKSSEEDAEMPDAEKTVVNGDADNAEASNNLEQTTKTEETAIKSEDVQMQDEPLANGTAKPSESPAPASGQVPSQEKESPSWHPGLRDLVERMPDVLPSEIQASMSVPFFVTFWSLSLGDLLSHVNSYKKMFESQKQLLNQIKNDRTDPTPAGAKERAKKATAITELNESLSEEQKTKSLERVLINQQLSKDKEHWFPKIANGNQERCRSLVQHCFLPRALVSPIDAHFSWAMLKALHEKGTPNFGTLGVLGQIMNRSQLECVILQCTTREAQNFGRFLNLLLKEMQQWHAKEKVYETRAWGNKKELHGFNPTGKENGHLAYEAFRRLLLTWHVHLNNALKSGFQSGDFMAIRNGITVLKEIAESFPKLDFHGRDMEGLIKGLGENEKRDDLKLAARSLLGDLARKKKNWITSQAFRLADPSKDTESPAPTAQPSATESKALNAAASEFKPSVKPEVNGDSKPTTTAGGDAEDGEIDDGKKAETKDVPMLDVPKQPAGPDRPPSTKPADAPQRPPPAEESRPAALTPVPRTSTPQPSVQANDNTRSALTQPAQPRQSLPAKPDTRSDSRTNGRSNGNREYVPARPDQEKGGYGRLDRPGDLSRSSSHRDRSPGRTSRARTPERDGRSHDRPGQQPPPADARSWEHPRDRRSDVQSGRLRMDDDRRMRDDARDYQPQRGVSSRAEDNHRQEKPLSAGSRTPQTDSLGVNPDRAALLGLTGKPEVRESRDDRRGHSSRRQSPSRDDRNTVASAPPRNAGRAPLQLQSELFQSRNETPSDRAPAGPRQDRPPQNDRPVAADPPPRRQSDIFERGPQQDSSYGRLNGPEVPSGPRGGQGPARNAAPTQPRANAGPQNAQNMSSAGPRPGSHSHAVPSGPSTPSVEQCVPVHPSRLAQLQPEPVQTNTPYGPASSRRSGGPPIGTPTGPSPTTRGAPSGPATPGSNRDRRFVGLNDHLQGAGPERAPSIRGRASNGRPNGGMIPPSGPASSHQEAPMQSPKIPDSIGGPMPHPSRASIISASPTAPQGAFGPPAQASQSNDFRIAGRSEESRHSDRHHSDRGSGRNDADRRNDNRYANETDPRSARSSTRDMPAPREMPSSRDMDHRDRRDDRPRYPDDPSRGQRSAQPYPPAAGSEPRSYAAPPEAFAGRGHDGRHPRDAGRGRDEYRGNEMQSRGSGGRGRDPRDDVPSAWEGDGRRDGRDGRDLRKRRNDDVGSNDPKRRRSGQ
ncbi:hypothetical protein MBLNU457_1723t2 [Dothideomycetes sp. NU457]